MRRIAIGVAAGAAVLTGAPAASQSWSELRDTLLDNADELFDEGGYGFAGFAHEGTLDDGQSEDIAIRLGAGLEFVVMGACDADCEDMDLALYDAAGNEVDSDFEMDDFPIVAASPASSGTYRLRVSMPGCTANPCSYALQTFVKR
jgi:hypothetical protein